MSELDVIVIHIRAEQAPEYERLFAAQELPRWRDHKAQGAFLSARTSRDAFGTDNRQNVAQYISPSRVSSHARTASMTPIPGSRSSTAWPTCCSQNPQTARLHAAGGLSDRHRRVDRAASAQTARARWRC